jgi:hypothetical protein
VKEAAPGRLVAEVRVQEKPLVVLRMRGEL